jgi:hypothetical protein
MDEDEDEVTVGHPPRRGLWVGGVEQLATPAASAALAPYGDCSVTGIYRLYACDGSLLYVGFTRDPLQRFRQHAKTKDWWMEVDHILVVPFGSERGTRFLERQIIRDERPLYNIQHSTREWVVR